MVTHVFFVSKRSLPIGTCGQLRSSSTRQLAGRRGGVDHKLRVPRLTGVSSDGLDEAGMVASVSREETASKKRAKLGGFPSDNFGDLKRLILIV